jgi:hypothetical protein
LRLANQEQAKRWVHQKGANTGASFIKIKLQAKWMSHHKALTWQESYNYLRSKLTAVTANMVTRCQASILKREQANSSHWQHGKETLVSYKTLIFYSKKGASQQQSWPT